MSKAIETLMTEHRLIEKVLGSLKIFIGQLEPAQHGARGRVAEYAEFFREFADRCHHGKEEDRLFTAMERHGFPSHAGPLFVMKQEHEIGRTHVRSLAGVGAGSGELSEGEVAAVREHAQAFIALLAAHIMKEDNVLFPLAEQSLPGPAIETLAGEFERFERSVMGAGRHERLHALAEGLIEAFPADTSVRSSGGGCASCSH